MHEQPIEVGGDHDKNWQFLKQFRDIHQDNKNISDERFHFRDETDWQSVLSPRERVERRGNQLMTRSYLQKTGLAKSLLNRNSTSQQPFVDIKKECYRDRHPSSEIQPAMTFAKLHVKPKTRPLLLSRDVTYSQDRYTTIHGECKRTKQHQQHIDRNIEQCITDRKSIILQRSMKYHPKMKSNKLSSTGSTFRRTVTSLNSNQSEQKVSASKSMIMDPIAAEEFSLGKNRRSKIYFKDVESIANLPNHQLSGQARQVMYDCNLYRYRKADL